MIKIQINNPIQKKQEYLDAILDRVAFRISALEQSLLHLNGNKINFNLINFQSLSPITKRIIKIIGGGTKVFADANDYTTKVSNYLINPIGLCNINIAGLIQFCQEMLANNNQILSELLVCDANDLMNLNETTLNRYRINSEVNRNMIKQAFDYTRYNDDIGLPIRQYFRENEFVKVCPYCNKKEALHVTNDNNEPVESNQLDHFYDKATFPLLAYCFFNLVPSDYTCNVTNKGTTEFTEIYHLNPHEEGYEDKIKFIPIGLTPSNEVLNIEVKILVNQGTALYEKINGNNPPNLEIFNLGNLNVFKIRSKYKNEKFKAGQILELVKSNDKNISHIKKYLKSLNGLNKELTYIDWYKKKINGSYYPETFNCNSYSKFCRDIHDFYYSVNGTRLNRYITDLINQ